VAVAGRDQGARSSSDSPLEGDVVRGFFQTRWAALHSGEQVIACGRNGVSEAEAQAALNNVKFLKGDVNVAGGVSYRLQCVAFGSND
jgi:hypothetical protein